MTHSPTPAGPVDAGSTVPEEFTIVSAPPRADCIADSAGGLTFDLDAPEGADASGHWSAALVLLRRGGNVVENPDDEVRLPLTPNGAGRLRAVLPSTVPLPEGRWDVHLGLGEAEPARLLPGLADLRSLVDRRPGPSTSPLAVRIPYVTKHGNLSLRSWQRAPHAEAGDLGIDAKGITVGGTLHRVENPEEWLAGAVAEARCRRDPQLVRTSPVTADGHDFSFTFALAELCEAWEGGPDVWDLWLCPADGSAAARVARLLDDVADKGQIFVYPAQPVDAPYAPAQAGPHYTADNDLAIRVDERPPIR
ncbi:hypothetical protein I5Q34_20190 [Streptomyces sp. AV19]|uniref:hypothetical protein n=1 Tax=Streptomyces sp. AV19 TaxID=2793068 RepID=UPI0018FEC7BE|nr:hypothetical protein [Streptomyces sp. AV19]MBH1936568.1 hypothetical protein [Streptomyces sp. AV19]MDG4532627.1 hypothetical protein [Streptomyces sp. AV19]